MKSLCDIYEFIQNDKKCPYLENKLCDTYFKIIQNCSSDEYSKMIERGWRRFGNVFFVPICKSCNECKTIRVDVKNFEFKKSYKRIINKNKDLKIVIQKPTISIEHINLYNKYHQYMSEKKDWPLNQIDGNDYHKSYVEGANDFGFELLYFYNDKLICVGLADIIQNRLISAVYTYYDPDFNKRSLGKFNIITQIMIAKKMKIPYWFPGFWIKDHHSMGYKEEYKPFEVLQNRPNLFEECIWKRY